MNPKQKPSPPSRHSDLDPKDWRAHQKTITTDALWIEPKKQNDGKFVIPKRSELPKNSKTFHGLFIPEIPYQFVLRFTRKGELVWDCFAGSGTTHKVCQLLGRRCVSNDLNPKESFVAQGDSRFFDPKQKVQLLFMHPPYHDIVRYSGKKADGSNCDSIRSFLSWFDEVASNCVRYLEANRFLILVCGNTYSDGEEHTLGVWCKDIVRGHGFKLKSQIVKDYGETKGGSRNYNMNYYRQLRGNFNNFYGDNIFVMQKVAS